MSNFIYFTLKYIVFFISAPEHMKLLSAILKFTFKLLNRRGQCFIKSSPSIYAFPIICDEGISINMEHLQENNFIATPK